MPTEPDPQSQQLSLPDDPFDDLYQQYAEATAPPKYKAYERLGTNARYMPAAKPITPVKGPPTPVDLVEVLFQLAEAVWGLTAELHTAAESGSGDSDGVQA